jgi:hypothetical protein
MARKKTNKPISKLSITETKNLIKSAKRKATIERNNLENIESEKAISKKEIRLKFEQVIKANKKIEKLNSELQKKQLRNKIKSNQQKINRNKGKDNFKVRQSQFEIEILKEKIKNPQFVEPEIIQEPTGENLFSYTSAFYYYNETKKKLLEMIKNKEIKSLNGLKSMKKISSLISEIFTKLDSEKAVQIDIDIDTDKAFINIISMEEAQEGETFVEPKNQ